MGVRIVGRESQAMAALYDSVTGLAFGPVFNSVYEAEDFLEWYGNESEDLRTLITPAVDDLVADFRKERG